MSKRVAERVSGCVSKQATDQESIARPGQCILCSLTVVNHHAPFRITVTFRDRIRPRPRVRVKSRFSRVIVIQSQG